MSEGGGNLDYERFMEEVVKPIKNENSFVYSKYNCQTKEMIKEYMNMESKVIVIEGAYSLRPEFQAIYDLKVLMLIDSGLQKKRINQRNEKMYDKFINEWIPKENSYLKHFEIQTNCDFLIKI